MSYLYETHAHTSEVSRCGRVPAKTVVENYAAAGYSGVVITDHFTGDYFRALPNMPWQDKIDCYLRGYRAAKATAAALDVPFTVLLGLELRLDTIDDDDFLIFGADETFLLQCEDVFDLPFEEMAQFVHDSGLLLVQAHPFRECMTIVDWRLLDGVEVYNGNPHHESNNPVADLWAERHHLLKTSGSDYHGEWGAHLGGIETAEPIRDNAHLLRMLNSGQYTLAYQEEK